MSEDIEVILVDIGNSSIKTTQVVDGNFQETIVWKDLQQILDRYEGYSLMVSSVRKLDDRVLKRQNTRVLTHQSILPITLDYKTPETLGHDRIAAAVGAFDLFPDKDNLIIDMGTCMTIDLVQKTGVFSGGVISPGLTMRMKSMAHFTDQLPDISEEWKELISSELGKSTKECLLSGSFWGVVHEINGIIKALEKDFTSLNIIITGGDAHFFESNVKAHIFAGSKIVQKGLYRIWKYQQ
jgi:type III pantothenate kinase